MTSRASCIEEIFRDVRGLQADALVNKGALKWTTWTD